MEAARHNGSSGSGLMSALSEGADMKLSYQKCPTCSAQFGACLSQNWLCSSQTPWARSSENKGFIVQLDI